MKRNVTGPFDPFPTMQAKVPCYSRCKQVTHILPPLARTGETSGVSRSRTTTEARKNSLELPVSGKSNKTAPIPPKLPNPLYRQVFPGLFSSWHKIMKQGVSFGLLQAPFLKPFSKQLNIVVDRGPQTYFFIHLIRAWQLELGLRTFRCGWCHKGHKWQSSSYAPHGSEKIVDEVM